MTGKNIRGALSYNETKVSQGSAEFLLASGYYGPERSLSFSSKLKQFLHLTRQNPRTKTNTLHISLNFSNKDQPYKGILKKVAADYMDRIGFGDQPFLVYQHFDAAHPHIHILTTNIKTGGQRIETHNIGKEKSEPARKEIEEKFGLIRAEDQKKDREFLLEPLASAYYGKTETKKAISNVVREVIRSYHFTSLPELNAILRQFNVTADRGDEGTRMRKKGGLIYCISDGKGNKAGVPIKASSIYSKPTLANLQKKFGQGKINRKKYKPRIREILNRALTTARSRDDLEAFLRKKGIRALFRTNEEGRIYGLTFIDNANRCVFNGSALGKDYGAQSVLSRINKEKDVTILSSDKSSFQQTDTVSQRSSKDTASEKPGLSISSDIPPGSDPVPYALRQKKKKKKRKKGNR